MNLVKRIESASLGVVALIALLIAGLDLAGALDGVNWLKSRIPLLTLLVAAAAVGHLAVAQLHRDTDLKSAVEAGVTLALRSTDLLQVRRFESRAEFWNYAADRVLGAKSSVDDLTWGPDYSTAMSTADLAAFERYRANIKQVSAGRGNRATLIYREIVSFPGVARLERVSPLMSERYPNFHLRYYDYEHAGTPPLLQFYIVDGEEIIVSIPTTATGVDSYFAFRGSQISACLAHYFELSWRGAQILKDAYGPRTERFEELACRVHGDEMSSP